MSSNRHFFNPRNSDQYFYDYQYDRQSFTWALCPRDGNYRSAIIKGIINDDAFSYSANHTYGEDSMFTKIGNFATGLIKGARTFDKVNQLVEKPLDSLLRNSPVMQEFYNTYKDSYETIKNYKIGGSNLSISDVQWGAFVSMINHIKYYSGTNISFSIPTLSTIYFDGDDEDDSLLGGNILERIKYYNNYFIGELTPLYLEDSSGQPVIDDGVMGIMNAPTSDLDSPYRPVFNTKLLDQFDGTYVLYLGENYKITNLVITNYQVELSTIKHRTTGRPLFAEIKISVEPASYVDRTKIEDCIIQM